MLGRPVCGLGEAVGWLQCTMNAYERGGDHGRRLDMLRRREDLAECVDNLVLLARGSQAGMNACLDVPWRSES